MWAIVRRSVVPVLLVIAGTLAIVEGVRYHPVTVLAEKTVERETTAVIDVPLPSPPGFSEGDPSSSDGPPLPGDLPFAKPPMMKKTVTRVVEEVVDAPIIISELDLTRDVTVGGVVRLASGALKRTYGINSKGPAVCPT
jgi:hypothetical protein